MQVVVVHEGWSGTEAQAKTWLSGFGVTFPAIHEGSPYRIMSSYTSDGSVPHTYIIGRDMIIRKDILEADSCSVIEGHVMDVIYMRNPIDVEMVMDVSDSMNSPSPSDPAGDSKLVMMKQAATMITDFLVDHGQVDDRMGLVWFTDDASEYMNPSGEKLLSVPINKADLKAQITAHGTGICTAMGAGLPKAFDTLSASTQRRFAILCTDGMQNIEPKVTEVGGHYEITDSGGWLCGGHSSVPTHPGVNITTYNTRVHTIGIGITATYSSLLQEIANATSGFYRGTDDPATDLDLIYFVDLCNCMAGGSPSVVHHNAGRLYAKECKAVENFYLNRSARKITAMLSWKKVQGSNLTFWLHAPDGSLLNLHNEMKQFANYCMATVYLPTLQNGKEISHVGLWRMIIRGEAQNSYADYHAFVIAEDREIKYYIDFPRKAYEVGDILPIKIKLTELKKPVTKVHEIVMETVRLRMPLEELLSQYKVSHYELRMKEKNRKQRQGPILLKLEAMETDPAFRDLLKPVRTLYSLQKGDLECAMSEKDIVIPFVLKQPGLCSFKIVVHCETPENGHVSRTDMLSVHVGPGKADPQKTDLNLIETRTKGKAGVQLRITPRNETGHLLGPGLSGEFNATLGNKTLELIVEDYLDGSYQLEIVNLTKAKAKGKEKRIPINITFQGKPLREGKIW